MADTTDSKDEVVEFDADALKDVIAEGTRSALTEYDTKQKAAVAADEAARRAVQVNREKQGDPVWQAIEPYVGPALRTAHLAAAAASDKADFYLSHPYAQGYQPQIEQMFKAAVEQGLNLDRASLWNHYLGANFDHFHKQATEAEKAAAQAAVQAGAVLGPGSGLSREMGAPVDASTLSDEDLAKALQGKPF